MINMIVAMAKHRAIGRDNELLVHLPDDLKWFKQKTSGHIVIMGSKTFKSLPGGALPNRDNIVLTKSNNVFEGVKIASDINQAIKLANAISEKSDYKKEMFIIGGESIYSQFIQYADRLYITHIFEEFETADTFFPEIDDEWKIVNIEASRTNIENEHPHVFVTYERTQG